MAYTYTTGNGPDALTVTEPAAGDNVATGDEAIRQIKLLLDDETWFKYTTSSGTLIFNTAGDDIDFRMEGDTNVNLFYLNAGVDAIGIGTASPDTNSLLHIHNATAGSIAASSLSFLTLENSASVFIEFLAPHGSDGGLKFSNPTGGSAEGQFYYDTSVPEFVWDVDGNARDMALSTSGVLTLNHGTAALRFDDTIASGTTSGAEGGYIIVNAGGTTKRIKLWANS